MMPSKLFKSVKLMIPQKTRNKIFFGTLYLRRKILNILSYTMSYPKIKYFLIFLHPSKEISAMLRVKNEEEYLFEAVSSIIDHVDEVILVDNESTDNTHQIIGKLKKLYPKKIFSYSYPHKIVKVGAESRKLGLKDKNSPSHIVNFTNWCLNKCTKPYILHWAGDHLATEELYQSIEKFKKSNSHLYFSQGLNLFPDLKHSVKTINNKKTLDSALFEGALDNYLDKLTYNECRIFPKKFSTHTYEYPYWETFSNPFLFFPKYHFLDKNISFLHLKFLKKDSYQILSKKTEKVIKDNIFPGEVLKKKYSRILENFNIKSNKTIHINPRRVFITIDGDGFGWQSKDGKMAGEIFLNEIITKYPFMFTVSVIAKDIINSHDKTFDLAKKIFSLKNIEPASHSWNHPRSWSNQNIDLNQEINKPIKYIDSYLLPKDKKVKIFLWTGRCNPNQKTLARVSKLNVLNLNGNRIFAPYVKKGKYKHFMSRSYPDWHYMNLKNIWSNGDSLLALMTYEGKLDGYKKIIDYFEENPSQPVHLWLHWYSAVREDSLDAIKTVLNWCLKQNFNPVFASEYINSLNDSSN